MRKYVSRSRHGVLLDKAIPNLILPVFVFVLYVPFPYSLCLLPSCCCGVGLVVVVVFFCLFFCCCCFFIPPAPPPSSYSLPPPVFFSPCFSSSVKLSAVDNEFCMFIKSYFNPAPPSHSTPHSFVASAMVTVPWGREMLCWEVCGNDTRQCQRRRASSLSFRQSLLPPPPPPPPIPLPFGVDMGSDSILLKLFRIRV